MALVGLTLGVSPKYVAPAPTLISHKEALHLFDTRQATSAKDLAILAEVQRVEVLSPAKSYVPIEVFLDLKFTNTSGHPMWLKTPHRLGFGRESGCVTDAIVRLYDDQGTGIAPSVVDIDCFDTDLPKSESAFVWLQPGESLTNTSTLILPLVNSYEAWGHQLPPGNYRVGLDYRNLWAGYELPPEQQTNPTDLHLIKNLNGWVGVAKSNRAVFAVPPYMLPTATPTP